MKLLLAIMFVSLTGCYVTKGNKYLERMNRDINVKECNKDEAIKIADKLSLHPESKCPDRVVRNEVRDDPDSSFYYIYYAPDKLCSNGRPINGGDSAMWISKKTCKVIKAEAYQ